MPQKTKRGNLLQTPDGHWSARHRRHSRQSQGLQVNYASSMLRQPPPLPLSPSFCYHDVIHHAFYSLYIVCLSYFSFIVLSRERHNTKAFSVERDRT